MHHCPRCWHKVGLAYVVPLFLFANHVANKFRHVVVRSATPHEFMEIVVPNRKKTGANLAVRGNANSAAMPAEWVGNRRDDSDFADAVIKLVTSCGFAASVWDFN